MYCAIVQTKSDVLVVVPYGYDENHPLFGHQKKIIVELANYFSNTFVLSVYGPKLAQMGCESLKSGGSHISVFTMGWESRGSRAYNALRFYRHFLPLTFMPRATRYFFYMTDLHCLLALPLIFWRRKNVFVWYAHKSPSRWLKLINRMVGKVFTSTSGSFPKELFSKDVKVIGQAIDFSLFPYRARNLSDIGKNTRAITFGRISPSKQIIETLDVLDQLSRNMNMHLIEWKIVGNPSNQRDKDYFCELQKRIEASEIRNLVKQIPSVSRSKLAETSTESNVFIHAAEGSLDKTLLEATSLGLPVITTNSEYHSIFGSWSPHPDDLTAELFALFSLNHSELFNEVIRRRKLVMSSHSIERWAFDIVTEMKQV